MSNRAGYRSASSSNEPRRPVGELVISLVLALLSLLVLAWHHMWWTFSRLTSDLDTRGVSARVPLESIYDTVDSVTVVASILVVALPIVAWNLRRSSWWIPAAVTVLAIVATGILNRSEVALVHSLVRSY